MPTTATPARIVDTAIALAEQRNWEAVRLYDVAARLGVPLDAIRHQFREKEELVDAWFDRADAAMLGAAETDGFSALPTRERLARLIMAWLDALAPHRRITRQMVLAKLEPGHLHIQIPALMRISRTVQWLREAAHRDAVLPRRALEETALTTLYLLTFGRWMIDDSPDSRDTRRFLDRELGIAEGLDHCMFRCHPQQAQTAPPAGPT
jgi:AcrR family transcriptional regulator